MSPEPPEARRGAPTNSTAPDAEDGESAAKSNLPPNVSVIIPAYNEEKRLAPTLKRIEEYLASRPYSAEIIVVDDGSRDATAQVVENFRAQSSRVRLISNGENRGKGYSVKHGMLEAKGNIALFTDADLSAPIEEADKLLAALEKHDVAIGSRAVNRGLIEVHQSGLRELAGKSFNLAVRVLVGLQFADTQCGFKAFRRARARILFEQQRIERFGFDPELLFLAHRHGLSVAEVPVRWAHDTGSRVHVLGDGLRMVEDLAVIRWNSLIGRYPASASPPGA
jgi:glycosyltransferase involved in cell wall biosynthesis